VPALPDYLISQHDPRGERADQLAAVRREYRYSMDFGFPVSATLGADHEPAPAWQLKALAKQEELRLNLLRLKRQGRWNFVNDLQPLAPHKLAAMVRENDMAGINQLLEQFQNACQRMRYARVPVVGETDRGLGIWGSF